MRECGEIGVVAIIVDHYLTNGIFPVVLSWSCCSCWSCWRDQRFGELRLEITGAENTAVGLELVRLKTGTETLNHNGSHMD